MTAPIEGKVYGGVIGTGSGAIVGTFLVWMLGVLVWHAPSTSEAATDAVAAVPGPVAAIVGLLVTLGGGYVGYMTQHTPRPVAEPQDVPADEQPADPVVEENATEVDGEANWG